MHKRSCIAKHQFSFNYDVWPRRYQPEANRLEKAAIDNIKIQ